MMITGEYKVKKQKNGNIHEYVYYHCSRKSKTTKCQEPCMRQEILDKQISSLLQKVSLPQDWAVELEKMLEKDKKESAQSCAAFVQEAREKIRAIQLKLQRLLDGYLEQDIERETYREQKAVLLSEKKSLEEQITRLEQKQNDWVEPLFVAWLGARLRAERLGFIRAKSMGGSASRPRNGLRKTAKSGSGGLFLN